MEPVFDLYRDSLEDIIDSNIDDGLPNRNNHLWPSKPSTPALQPRKAVLLLSRFFGNGSKATSSKRNNSRSLPVGMNLSPRLPSSIVPKDPFSPFLKSDDHRL